MGVDHHRQRAFGVLRSIDPDLGASLGADVEDAVIAPRGRERHRHRLLGAGKHVASRLGREREDRLCARKAVDEGLRGRLELAHEVPPVLFARPPPWPLQSERIWLVSSWADVQIERRWRCPLRLTRKVCNRARYRYTERRY